MTNQKCWTCGKEIDYSEGFYSESDNSTCFECYMYYRRRLHDVNEKVFNIALAWVSLCMIIMVVFMLLHR